MAEQAEEAALLDTEDKEVAPESKRNIKNLIPVMAIIPIVAALSFLFVTKIVNPRVASSADDVKVVEEEEEAEEETEGVVWELGTKLANPLGSRSLRFAKVSVSLELDSAEIAAKAEAGKARLEDIFLTILSSKTLTEMGSPAGKRGLKRELKESFTSDLRLKEGDIRWVYFREFVIQ